MMNRQPTPEEKLKIQAHYRQHPEFFFKYFLGIEAWDKQLEIAQSVIDNRVTTVRSCHSAGKSYIAACIALWYISAYPESIVITTAPTWRQVKDILWRNITTRYAKARIPLGGNEPNMTGWEVATNWFAIGVSSKDPDKIQGYHAESGNLLVICDEAAGIAEAIFEGIDAVLTGSKCRKLEIGNPTSDSGTFRENHKPASTAHRIKISAFDTPNFTANNIKNEDDLLQAIREKRPLKEVADYLISPVWVYERIKKWGINSPIYVARVAAEFPDVGENNLIPLSWVEAASTDERLEKVLGLKLKHPNLLGSDGRPTMSEAKFEQIEAENDRIRKEKLAEYIAAQNTVRGADISRFGSDSTVVTPRWGKIVGQQASSHKESLMQTAGRLWPMITNLPTDLTAIDVIGLGGGVVDRLHELQEEQSALGHGQFAQVVGVDVNTVPEKPPEGMEMMRFANLRAELYWRLRAQFESGDIYLMPDEDGNPPEDLQAELSAIEYKFLGDKIYIEEKADMKKRLHGKSPDHADSLMLTETHNHNAAWNVDNGDTTFEEEETNDEDDDWEPATHAGGDSDSYDDSYSGSFDY